MPLFLWFIENFIHLLDESIYALKFFVIIIFLLFLERKLGPVTGKDYLDKLKPLLRIKCVLPIVMSYSGELTA